MSDRFGELVLAAKALLHDPAYVNADVDRLAYELAVRQDVQKWYAREAVMSAIKEKDGPNPK